MARVYNFSAGPAVLPEEVLLECQKELLDYQGLGMSVMEMSHRSPHFEKIVIEAEKDLRTLLNVPSNYKILFLQGGGTTQFAMIAMNLMKNRKADYIVSGHWSEQAYEEATLFGDIKIIASGKESSYTKLPDISNLEIRPDADYVFMCDNNTLFGTKFKNYPDTKNIPLVIDISSNIFSEVIDISKFGLIFAGAQKNAGIAGATIVIIRDDLLGFTLPGTPSMLNYSVHVKGNSIFNTPPTFAVYMTGKMLKWMLSIGGVKKIQEMNKEKSDYLYNYLDNSSFYKTKVLKDERSRMNVLFSCGNEETDIKFAKEAALNGLVDLKGHRRTGGIRVSMYNAMPFAGVKKLVEFMDKFAQENGGK